MTAKQPRSKPERDALIDVPVGLLMDLLRATDYAEFRAPGGQIEKEIRATRDALLAWIREREAEGPGLEFARWLRGKDAPIVAPPLRDGSDILPSCPSCKGFEVSTLVGLNGAPDRWTCRSCQRIWEKA